MKTLLITGGNGFIGSFFIRKMFHDKLNYRLVSIDKILYPSGKTNIYQHKNHTFYLGDFADSHFVDRVFDLERPNLVIHLGAESFVDKSLQDAKPFIHSNVLGTQVLIDASLKYGVERFILASTDEVMGHLESDQDRPWTEEDPPNPRNIYSTTKLASEGLVRAAGQAFNLSWNITRSCNVFGVRQPARNLIPVVIKHIIENKPIPVYGKGQNIREWVPVSSHCDAFWAVINQGVPNQIYNISTGWEFTNLEMVNQICKIFNRGWDSITFVPDCPGHDFRYALDSTKLRALGWTPQWKFQEALHSTIEWYNLNKWFLNLENK